MNKILGWNEFLNEGAINRTDLDDRLKEISGSKEELSKIANKFSELLLEEIGKEKLDEVVSLNKEEENDDICHSHDFCDANVLMAEAFAAVGIDLDKDFPAILQNKEILDIWNQAWALAKSNEFKQL